MSKLIDVIGSKFELKNITKKVNGLTVTIKTFVDIDTFSDIVQTIAKSCFQDDGYHAEFREIASRFVILKNLTDIDIDDVSIDEVFKTTQGGTWYEEIMREIRKMPVWGEIDLAIDRQIDYMIATRQTAFDKLCMDLSSLIKTDNTQNLDDVKEILDGLNKVDQKAFAEAAINNALEKNKNDK